VLPGTAPGEIALERLARGAALAEQLRRLGFAAIEDLGPREVTARFLAGQRPAAAGTSFARLPSLPSSARNAPIGYERHAICNTVQTEH
jgi:hypothetical protein